LLRISKYMHNKKRKELVLDLFLRSSF